MIKYFLAAVGIIFILFGGVDYCIGALMPHDRYLLWVGIAMLISSLVVIGIMRMRERSRKPKAPLVRVLVAVTLCGVSDVCAETIHAGTLTPPDKWLMVRNPFAPTGPDFWTFILLLLVIVAITAYLMPWLSRRWRK